MARKRGGVGVIITTPEGDTLKYGVQLQFPATNNEVEYEAILTGLRVEKALGAKNLLLQSDSKLVVEQIKEEYKAKEERMQKYLRLTRHLAQEFDRVKFIQVPKSQNMGVDEIVKQALSKARSTSTDLKMEVQKHPSIEKIHTFTIQSKSSKITPILSFLQDGRLP